MSLISDDEWFCVDCMLAHASGDMPENPERAAEVDRGFARLSGTPAMNDKDDDQEFSWSPCDCCGSRLGGSRHHFALFDRT